MRSSTSDSKRLSARAAIALLLGAIALYFCLLEACMRLVVPLISEGQHRQRDDYRAILIMQPSTPAGARSVLVVGNSLLLQGVVRSQLQSGLAPTYATQLFPIEGTRFFDWYFGLRRFFSEGSHPAVVILCMGVRELISNSTDGEGFAYFMMKGSDLLQVRRATGLDMMAVSDYFFAHISGWFGIRTYFRKGVLGKWMPDAPVLAGYFSQVDPVPLIASDAVIERALGHLKKLQDLCKQHGADFIMVLPPTLYRADPAPAVARAAAKRGIPVLLPYQPAELSAAEFVDGFHLNGHGAVLFTSRLEKELSRLLGDRLTAISYAEPVPQHPNSFPSAAAR